jgi:hypothetical protein
MRLAYAHDALLKLPPGAASSAPGRAAAAALSGPHHTTFSRDGERLRLHILFAASPDRVDELRARIDASLAAGDWQLIESGCVRVDPADRDDARRLFK